MGLYTVDKSALFRGLVYPEEQDMKSMIFSAGNKKFTHHGFDEIGIPIIGCEVKPMDSSLHGVIWINKFLEV
jgi:hypothetical protein